MLAGVHVKLQLPQRRCAVAYASGDWRQTGWPAQRRFRPIREAFHDHVRMDVSSWSDYDVLRIRNRLRLLGANAFVIMPYRGTIGRGIFWMMEAAPKVVTMTEGVYLLHRDQFYSRWRTEVIGKGDLGEERYARLRAVGKPARILPTGKPVPDDNLGDPHP